MDLTTSTPLNSFPPLKMSDILDCMRELGMELTKQELLEPSRNKERVRQIYIYLLEVCSGKVEEDFQPSPKMMETAGKTDYPDLHSSESFNEFTFFTELSNLMEICGYYDFSWRDLHAPESKRLRLQLSAVLNLAKFREEQLKVYAELNEPRAELLQALEEVTAENQELKNQLEALETESQNKNKEAEAVMDECEELELEIARNNQLQSAAREEAAALKKRAKDLQDELDTAAWGLEEAEAEEENLRQKVVSSPDRRRAEVTQRREKLNDVKQNCAQLEESIQDYKKKLINMDQISAKLQALRNALSEIQLQAKEHSELVAKTDATQDKIKETEKDTAIQQQSNEQAERELHRAEEKILQERKQQGIQMEAVMESIEEAKAKLLHVEKDRREGMAKVEEGEARVLELEGKIKKQKEESDAQAELMIAEYKKIEQLFLSRNAQRMAIIEASS